jgi:hypothetical protein
VANLSEADLSEADLSEADLRWANLSEADLSKAILPDVPKVENLCKKIIETIPAGGLEMSKWHTCETTHCLAGWAVHLAGQEGFKLQAKFKTNAAGALIWNASIGKIPDFYSSNEKAIKFLHDNA